MDQVQFEFSIGILIMSVVIHEVSHGFVAYMQGDPTAKLANRLTLNPIRHLELMGSFIIPIATYTLSGGSFTFGWAKPVPYNSYNLRNQRWGELLVASAGPLSNILIALIFSAFIRLGSSMLPLSFLKISALVVLINLGLAIFNLVPIPPLDGSKVLFAFIPFRFYKLRQYIERYSVLLILFFIFFLYQYIGTIITYAFVYLTGLNM